MQLICEIYNLEKSLVNIGALLYCTPMDVDIHLGCLVNLFWCVHSGTPMDVKDKQVMLTFAL